MKWQELQRRLLLPLVGGMLGVCSYSAMAHPATSETSVARGYGAIWVAQPASATGPLREALVLDPGSPERWTDFAEAMYEAGREDDARYCVEQAMKRAPGLPHIAMRSAGMYFRLGDPVAAMRLTNRVLQETREYDASVFQMWQRLGGNTRDVFTYGIGQDGRAARGYLRFLAESGDMTAADEVWKASVAQGAAGAEESKMYANALIRARDYERVASIESGLMPEGVANGGFEFDLAGGNADWKIEEYRGAAVSRDQAVRFRGNSSLHLEFDGTNKSGFGHVYQIRALSQGVWHLRAMVRTEFSGLVIPSGPSATQGVGLRVTDNDSGQVLAETSRLNVTHDWMPVETKLAIGPHARLVRVEVVRPASSESAIAMTGSAWIDDVTMKTEASK